MPSRPLAAGIAEGPEDRQVGRMLGHPPLRVELYAESEALRPLHGERLDAIKTPINVITVVSENQKLSTPAPRVALLTWRL